MNWLLAGIIAVPLAGMAVYAVLIGVSLLLGWLLG